MIFFGWSPGFGCWVGLFLMTAFNIIKKRFESQDNDSQVTRGGVMVKALNCEIVVREFKLQSPYYVHFRTNTLEKGMKPQILAPMG